MAVDQQYADAVRELAQLREENIKLRAACADLLSVRDQFAKAALQLFLELEVTGVWNQSLPDADKHPGRDHAGQVARAAYRMADAMMAARASGVMASDGKVDCTQCPMGEGGGVEG